MDVHEALAGIADQIRAKFSGGRRALTPSTGTVHHLSESSWFGHRLPAPACQTGLAGWDPNRLEPTWAPVSCARCQATYGTGTTVLPGQLPLFEPEPAPEQ